MEKGKSGGLNRRKFVVGAGAVGVGVAGGIIGSQLFPREVEKIITGETEYLQYARVKGEIRHDPTLCIGCRKCMLACSLSKEGVCDLSLARLRLDLKPFDSHHVQNLCRQCPIPLCMFACPWDAIVVDAATGARVVDEAQCRGDGGCVEECPYGMIHMKGELAFKCDLCGGDPVCVKACPTGALTYVEL